LNEVIARSFASAGIPVTKEPSGIYRDSVKRPDGVTLVPWQSGWAMAWDVTVATTLAESYLPASSATAAAAAEAAASRKEVKYFDLPASFHSHFSQLRWRHWDRSMNQLLTCSASWGVGSPPSSKRSDRPPIFSRGCQSLCSDTMQWFCRTAGHQWNNSF